MKQTRTAEMVAVVIFMSMSAPVAHALQVDVLSQWFSISGTYNPGDGSPLISYDVSGPEPVNSPYNRGYGGSTYASGSIGPSGMVFEAQMQRQGDSGISLAEILFRPTESASVEIVVDAFSTGVSSWSVNLIDDTTGTTLLDLRRGPIMDFHQTYAASFDTGHFYLLRTQAEAFGNDGSGARVMGPFTIPEPSSTSLLLVLALSAFGLRRRFCG